jgi:fatty-acyl-CoA synthase
MAEATLAITFVPRQTGVRTDAIDPKSLHVGAPKPMQGGQELVDCGRSFPDHELAIVDEHGNRLGDRHVGQIVTRGPSVTSGYFNEPQLTAESWRPIAEGPDLWLHTGDLGYTVDGNVFVCGRVKDMIIIRGRNYYPSDIEWMIGELPGVRRGNVVAFGVNDEAGEEQLVICAEAHQSDAAALVDTIMSAVAAQFSLSVHKVEIVPQGSLPRTSSGKPQRRKTKQMFVEGTLPRARSVHGSEKESEDSATSGA